MHKYLPHTDADIKAMLDVVQANDIDELFQVIPESLKLTEPYKLPSALGDYPLTKHMQSLANENQQLIVFRGAGAYDVYMPSVVKQTISRQEFLTSYTPYQPEVSQGTLQYIFEYQSMIAELTGMDVSNASMYDGATATAEAMFMAYAQTKKNRILVSETIQPSVLKVVQTYARFRGIIIDMIPSLDGITDQSYLNEHINESMGVILQTPNRYGIIENYNKVADTVHEAKGLFILNQEGLSTALFKNAGTLNADIACGELQALGLPLSFGGAYLGYLATKKQYVRKMPGRICGMTKDVDGKRAFVLTLQAREQHIRRSKANSNICSNQSLMALAVTVYLSLLGRQGFIDVARETTKKAHYLYKKLMDTNQFEMVYDAPFFQEFVLKAKFDTSSLDEKLLKAGFLGPLPLGDNKLLFAVSEKRSIEEIDAFVERLVK